MEAKRFNIAKDWTDNPTMVDRLADLLKQPLDDYSLEVIAVAELYGDGKIKESDILELKKRYAKLMKALMEDDRE